jgi:phenylacetate-CoA ligase
MSSSNPIAPAWAQVADTLRWVERASPFYREKFAAAGVRAGDIRTPEDFRRVPLTRKAEVPAAQKTAPPFGPLLAVAGADVATIDVSPGPLYIPRTAREPTGVEALHESFRAMGVRAGDVAHVTLSYHVMPGGLRLHRAFESYGCRVINGGTGNSELQVRVASDLRATVYAGTPSFLANLIDVAARLGLKLHYRLGFSTAETLTAALRQEIQRRGGIELFNHCGEALIGPLAGECRRHDGMHLHSREMWIEFLDPENGDPVRPGDTGELVVTQLGERAMPLVRYAPGDLCRTYAEPCGCGDPAPRVEILGQVGALRKIRGVLVHPAQVHETISAFPELGRFQILIDGAEGSRYDRAVIRIGCDDGVDRGPLTARVGERLRANLMVQMEVELVGHGEIPEAAGPPRFAEAFVDRRKQA